MEVGSGLKSHSVDNVDLILEKKMYSVRTLSTTVYRVHCTHIQTKTWFQADIGTTERGGENLQEYVPHRRNQTDRKVFLLKLIFTFLFSFFLFESLLFSSDFFLLLLNVFL